MVIVNDNLIYMLSLGVVELVQIFVLGDYLACGVGEFTAQERLLDNVVVACCTYGKRSPVYLLVRYLLKLASRDGLTPRDGNFRPSLWGIFQVGSIGAQIHGLIVDGVGE